MTNRKAIEILRQYDVSDLHFYTTDGEEIPFTEWSDALEMAISALQAQDVPVINVGDINSETQKELNALFRKVAAAPIQAVQPEPSEITDEQAILHLQSTGWMQNHDREMYESGLREQLTDDSGSYNNLITCEDTISRTDAIKAVEHITSSMSVCVNTDECHGMKRMQRQAVIELVNLPSAQPEHGWTPVSKGLPNLDRYNHGEKWEREVLITGYLSFDDKKELFVSEALANDVINYSVHDTVVTAWMPLPGPWRGYDTK